MKEKIIIKYTVEDIENLIMKDIKKHYPEYSIKSSNFNYKEEGRGMYFEITGLDGYDLTLEKK